MKIIHLNTYGNGGAGRACLRLNKALNDQQMDSQVWINFSLEENNQVSNFSAGFFQKWLTAAGIVLENLIAKIYTKPIRVPFSFPIWGRNLSNHPALREADIIHIHWINHAFLRPRDLARLAELKKPIVWTFHDCNAFTGGCHYPCDRYEQACGCCPILKKAHSTDWSHKIWNAKYQAYSYLNFDIIAPSQWMANMAQKSKLLSSCAIHTIPYTLDTFIFKPFTKEEARKILGMPQQKFILMSGFMPSRKDLRKGTSYLVEAVQLFVKQHSVDPAQIELLIFGNRNKDDVPDFGVKATFMGVVSDDKKLSLCYSAADVFLAPSLEDNLPNTVMESLACGTPVVAFTTGGIPDMVLHKQNGYLASYKSSSDFAAGINWIYKHSDRENLNRSARQTVEDRFSENLVAKKHIALYQKLMENVST